MSAIGNFTCRDKNVESFLKEKAVDFDKRNVSRTYVMLKHEALMNREFIIAAYFTASIKTLNFGPNVSKRMKKDIDGFSKDAEAVSAVLIGQLGKDAVHGKEMPGVDALLAAVDLAYNVRSIVGSRIVFLECEPAEKLLEFYNANGFVRLQVNQSSGLTQMVRFL